MIAKPLDQITEADLTQFLNAGVAERKTLDYKQQLPDMNDAGKKELLADVSSFANTAGGDLVFGVSEVAGLPTAIPGVSIADTDQLILRLDSIIRDGLSPRIRHTTRAVPLANGNYVLIIRSERSWYGPHRLVFRGDSRFYGRTTNGKTVNVKLAPEAAPLYKAASLQYRRLKILLTRLEKLTDHPPKPGQTGPVSAARLTTKTGVIPISRL